MNEEKKLEAPEKATRTDIKKLHQEAGEILSKIQLDTLELYVPEEKPFAEGGFNTLYKSKKAMGMDGADKHGLDSKAAFQPMVISYIGGSNRLDRAGRQKIKKFQEEKVRSQAILNCAGFFSPFVINPYFAGTEGPQISPRAEGGDFANLINDFYERGEKIPSELAKQIAIQYILSLEHTHEKYLANRDLKPENTLFWEKFKFTKQGKPDSKNTQPALITLCDVESFEQIDKNGHLVNEKSNICGSEDYVHPTIMEKARLRDYAGYRQQDHRKGDLYSLGKIIEILVLGRKLPASLDHPQGKKFPPLLANDTRQDKIIFKQFKQLYNMLCQPDLADIPGLKTVHRTKTVRLDNGRIEQIDSEHQEYADLRNLPLFGDSTQSTKFFQELHDKATAARKSMSGGFHLGHPVPMDNAFNLIPPEMKPVFDQFQHLASQIIGILGYQAGNGQIDDIKMSALLAEMCQSHEAFLEMAKNYEGFAKNDVADMQLWIKKATRHEPFPQALEQWKKFAELRQESDRLELQANKIKRFLKERQLDQARGELDSFKKAAAEFSNKTEPCKECPLFMGVYVAMQKGLNKTSEHLTQWLIAKKEEKPPSRWPKRLFKLYQVASLISGIAAAALIVLGIISGPIGWIVLGGLAAIVLTTNVYLSSGWKRVLSVLLLLLAVGACVVMALALLSNPAGWLMLLLTVGLPILALTLWTGFVNYQHSQQIGVQEASLQPLDSKTQQTAILNGNKTEQLLDLEPSELKSKDSRTPRPPISITIDNVTDDLIPTESNKHHPDNSPSQKLDNSVTVSTDSLASELKSNDSGTPRTPISITVDKVIDSSIPTESNKNHPDNQPPQELDSSRRPSIASTVSTDSSASRINRSRRSSDSSIVRSTLEALQGNQAFHFLPPTPSMPTSPSLQDTQGSDEDVLKPNDPTSQNQQILS